TMAAGTLAVYAWGLTAPGQATKACTLAFTTFVLFQFFNIFNARAEYGSAFNRQFFANGKLWLALLAVLGLQALAVHWAPAQAVFGTVDLSAFEWSVSIMVASTTLLLEEGRKGLLRLLTRCGADSRGAAGRGGH
ncbi:MAG TPA: cation-translocating P-type ATPase C-terminal domain-containing protein, partial [Rhodocyclaceae bacterium]|nr:cation-translocating P-type ATPase C-terminal domain-containing protein [Rhodocyclaceae bacterium]